MLNYVYFYLFICFRLSALHEYIVILQEINVFVNLDYLGGEKHKKTWKTLQNSHKSPKCKLYKSC